MIKNNLTIFNDQLQDVVLNHTSLKILQDNNGISFLRGILDIPNDKKVIVGQFFVDIRCSDYFPYRFPDLYEIGGEIPNEADWHKFPDGRCCITVLPDEIIICKNGISVLHFIEKFAFPYFANHIYMKLTGHFKNGEYAHGPNGFIQFYTSLMKTGDTSLWIQYFKNAFRFLKVGCERNDPCFCGSEVKFKRCHMVVFETLRLIGEEEVIREFKLMKI